MSEQNGLASTGGACRMQTRLVAPLKAFREKGKERSALKDPSSRPEFSYVTSNSFGRLFFALPNELQMQILSDIPFPDILSLRRSSRLLHRLITENEAPIVRHQIKHFFPEHLLELYPPPSADVDLHYLFSLARRQRIGRRLAFQVREYILREICLMDTAKKRRRFESRRRKMEETITPALYTLMHFFENYRSALLDYCIDLNRSPGQRRHTSPADLEIEIMKTYDSQRLMQAHEIYKLLLQSFARQIRPTTYAGLMERLYRRGWTRPPPSDGDAATLLVLGGIEEIGKIFVIHSYAGRRKYLSKYIQILVEASDPVKSKAQEQIYVEHQQEDGSLAFEIPALSTPTVLVCKEGCSSTPISEAPSLPSALSTVLDNIPDLRSIWVDSAEALLLGRGVVDNLDDIQCPARLISELLGYDFLRETDPTREVYYYSGGSSVGVGNEDLAPDELGFDGLTLAESYAGSAAAAAAGHSY
ncbi:MAG: hypothetical protein M1819_003037 [Sarea resinae]|nr:MAG: hypothetical protein M1819_003037 [Sarea resinae]